MTDAGPVPGSDRVDGPSEGPLPSRHRPEEPGPIGTGVYTSRPLAPLPAAVSDALGSPTRREVLDGPEVGPLWRRPVLRARLVQAFGDHALRCGAGRVVAVDDDLVPLAASVAGRLGVPLERPGEADDGPRPASGGRAYLVARVLHEREEGRRFSGRRQPPKTRAGAGVLFRVRSTAGSDMTEDNVLYIIDL